MYSLTVPEARSSKSRCQHGSIPSEGSRGNPSSSPPASGGQVFLGIWLLPPNLRINPHTAFSSSLPVSLPCFL